MRGAALPSADFTPAAPQHGAAHGTRRVALRAERQAARAHRVAARQSHAEGVLALAVDEGEGEGDDGWRGYGCGEGACGFSASVEV